MSGIGHNRETYDALVRAAEAYAQETYGDDYVLQDFVMLGYVVSMTDSNTNRFEYVMASSSCAPHIIEGLISQTSLFDFGAKDEEDD